jgi:hypothetical protein
MQVSRLNSCLSAAVVGSALILGSGAAIAGILPLDKTVHTDAIIVPMSLAALQNGPGVSPDDCIYLVTGIYCF